VFGSGVVILYYKGKADPIRGKMKYTTAQRKS
jgi:hypothetical protein